MKKILALCLSVFTFFNVNAQAKDPVKWVASYKSISATEGEITLTATIDKGWHIYSQTISEDGPIPTSFSFAPSKAYELNGNVEEVGAVEVFDNAFQAKISSFSDKGVFKQKIKLSAKAGFSIPLKVEYMCCDDKMCLPPRIVDLTIKTQ